MSIAPRKYTEFSTKQRKICCVQTRRVLTNNLNYTLTSNTATVPCPASSSGLILWHRFYNDDSPFGPSFLLIKIQATMDNDLIILILSLDRPKRICSSLSATRRQKIKIKLRKFYSVSFQPNVVNSSCPVGSSLAARYD